MEPGDRRFAKPEGKGEEESELFCGSLSWDASEDDIYNLFAEYGEVKNVKLLKDYEGRSRGRAFVLFADPSEAAAALAMNGQEHMGRQLVVNYSSDKPAPWASRGGNAPQNRAPKFDKPASYDQENELFCGSLSWDASEDDIYNLFAPYGEVVNVKLIKDYQGRSRGRAFVKLSSPEEAAAGLAVNGTEHMGRELIVNYSSDKPTTNTQQPRERNTYGNAPSATVVVRNMSYDTTEETLRDLFKACGSIEDCRIAMDADGYAKGFAHIDFDSAESSASACELTGSELDGRTVHIKYAAERKANLRK